MGWWRHPRTIPLITLALCTVLLLHTMVLYRHSTATDTSPLAEYAPQDTLFIPHRHSSPDTEKPQPILPDNPVNFAALQAESPDVVAWIKVPNTIINFPVMQSDANTEEDFYLKHNPKGEKDRNGSIYIQKHNRADFSDPNTVLYGHNMAGGKMFGAIHKFKKADYFKEHEYIYVYIPGHELVYRTYALFDFDSSHLLWAYDFSTEEGYQKFIDKTLNPKTYNRLVREGVVPTTADRVITLSTCQNTGDGRLLLVAVLESDTLTK